MGIAEIIILLIIAIWFILALVHLRRNGTSCCGGGKCSGDCSHCTNCSGNCKTHSRKSRR